MGGARNRYNAFIDRHAVAWELAMALLAIIYVAVGFALDDPALQPMAATLETAELEEVVPRTERPDLTDRPIDPAWLDRVGQVEPELSEPGKDL
jgi:hypothetical protein